MKKISCITYSRAMGYFSVRTVTCFPTAGSLAAGHVSIFSLVACIWSIGHEFMIDRKCAFPLLTLQYWWHVACALSSEWVWPLTLNSPLSKSKPCLVEWLLRRNRLEVPFSDSIKEMQESFLSLKVIQKLWNHKIGNSAKQCSSRITGWNNGIF